MRNLGRATLLLGLVAAPALANFAGDKPREPTDEERREEVYKLLDPGDTEFHNQQVFHAANARKALEQLRVLLQKFPNDAELHWLAGTAWRIASDEFGAEKSPREPVEAAIAQLQIVRRLAPDGGHAESVAADLGILYSKLGDFPHALEEYDRALKVHNQRRLLAGVDPGASLLYGNSAETLMALGRLDAAITRYHAAADAALAPNERGLAWYGLAVAYDRDEQIEKAQEAIRQALALDPPMEYLSDPNVFFMPAGEKDYYLGLGQLQKGDAPAAAESFRKFLAELPGSRWANRARAHLVEIAGAPRRADGSLHIAVGRVLGPNGEDTNLQGALQANEPRLVACFPRRSFTDAGNDVQLDVEVRRGEFHVARGQGIPDGTLRCIDNVMREWRWNARATARSLLITVPLHLESK
jgi:tetratricopeptide (TPR) repeat protein